MVTSIKYCKLQDRNYFVYVNSETSGWKLLPQSTTDESFMDIKDVTS